MDEHDGYMVANKIAAAFGLNGQSRLFIHAIAREDWQEAHALLGPLSRVSGEAHIGLDAAGLNPAERLVEMREATAVLAFSTGIAPLQAQLPAEKDVRRQLTGIEESRRIPYLLCALPNARKAEQLRLPMPELERLLVDAIALTGAELESLALPLQTRLDRSDRICIRSPRGCELMMSTRDRQWHFDDGIIDDHDRRSGAIVSNLPAGSLYATVVEESAQGSLFFSNLFGSHDVRLDFKDGVIERFTSERGDGVQSFFDGHTGDAKRIGHIGLGLNARLTRPLDWSLVDEHVNGSLFVSFGENRYMGGSNASSLNADAVLEDATLCIGDDIVFP